jgi:hypothetical protein
VQGWVVRTTFDLAPDESTLDRWEAELEQRGVDGTCTRIPDLHQAVVSVYLPITDIIKATCEGHDIAVGIVGEMPVGIETITEDEQERRAAEPIRPELMSAAEIAEELGVRRQRLHQLRWTAAFPAPLAELRRGAVAGREGGPEVAHEWTRTPGQPRRTKADGVR